jgi:quercetin dioxygenase-like cupin family protein
MSRIGILIGSLALGVLPLAAIAADQHVAVSPDSLKWGPAPPALPKGAEAVTLTGDPTKEGPYAYRIKVPAGYKVPPHQHPVDENVTVISGSFHIGMGDKFDPAKGMEMPAGAFGTWPAGMKHYVWVKGETVVQFHGDGPWTINYLNPKDDPRNAKK